MAVLNLFQTFKVFAEIIAENIIKSGDCMDMQEVTRLIIGLRSAGWSEKDINDFLIYIESGEDQYKPKSATKTTANDNSEQNSD